LGPTTKNAASALSDQKENKTFSEKKERKHTNKRMRRKHQQGSDNIKEGGWSRIAKKSLTAKTTANESLEPKTIIASRESDLKNEEKKEKKRKVAGWVLFLSGRGAKDCGRGGVRQEKKKNDVSDMTQGGRTGWERGVFFGSNKIKEPRGGELGGIWNGVSRPLKFVSG